MLRLLKISSALLAVTAAMLAALSVISQPPGIEPGKIRPCPTTPNCVSSLALIPAAQVLPLATAGTIPWTAVRSAVEHAGGTIMLDQEAYLWATFTSTVFRFVDDLEIRRDPDGTLQVRSASRVGSSDLGVNRRRVNALRDRLRELSAALTR
jgi:uncharacterized protein (DUF1499 family)